MSVYERPHRNETALILKELKHMSKYPGNYGWVPGAALELIEELLANQEPGKLNQND